MNIIEEYVKKINDNLARLQSDKTGEEARSHIVAILENFVLILNSSNMLNEDYIKDVDDILENMRRIVSDVDGKKESADDYYHNISDNSEKIDAIVELLPTEWGIFSYSLIDHMGDPLTDSNGNQFRADIPCFYKFTDE